MKVCALCICIMLDILPSLKQTGFLDTNVRNPPVLQSLESPVLSNSEMPFRGRKTGQI